MYVGAAVVTDLVGVKRGNRQTRKEPWRKRRLEDKVNILNKDMGRVNARIQQKTIKNKHPDSLQRRYKIQRKGLRLVKEEMKELRSSVIELTNTNKIDYSNITNTDSTTSFWSDIWSKEADHNKDAEWLEDFRHVMSDTQQ